MGVGHVHGSSLRQGAARTGKAWLDVALLEPERVLGLRATIDARTGRPFDPAGPQPKRWIDALWLFVLDPRGTPAS
jgi:hypothetical protein